MSVLVGNLVVYYICVNCEKGVLIINVDNNLRRFENFDIYDNTL